MFEELRTYAAAAAKSLPSCPTLCDPIDGSPPGSSVPRIFQARVVCVLFSLCKSKLGPEGLGLACMCVCVCVCVSYMSRRGMLQ